MATVTLEAYERAERDVEMSGARMGMVVHAVATLLVCAAVIPINIVVAPEFPWSVFPVVGMVFGLLVHWWFGYFRLEDNIRRHQLDVERRASAI